MCAASCHRTPLLRSLIPAALARFLDHFFCMCIGIKNKAGPSLNRQRGLVWNYAKVKVVYGVFAVPMK